VSKSSTTKKKKKPITSDAITSVDLSEITEQSKAVPPTTPLTTPCTTPRFDQPTPDSFFHLLDDPTTFNFSNALTHNFTPNRISTQLDQATISQTSNSTLPWFPHELSFSTNSIHTNSLPPTAESTPNRRTYANAANQPPIELSTSPTTARHRADEERQNNINNTLRFWLSTQLHPSTIIEDISKSLNRPPEDILVGVHRDTRVKTANKIDVIFKSKEVRDHVSANGVTINNHHVKATIPKPRPPPSIRAYLPNFPISATPLHLQLAALSAGVKVVRISRKSYRSTNIATGGWFLWAEPSTPQPATINFEDEEFSIIWKTNTNTNNNSTTIINNNNNNNSNNNTINNNIPTEKDAPTAQSVEQNNPPESDDSMDEDGYIRVKKKKKKKKKKTTANPQNQLTKPNRSKQFQLDQNLSTTTNVAPTKVRNTDRFPLDPNQVLFRNFPKDTSISTCTKFITTKIPTPNLIQLITDSKFTAIVATFKNHKIAHDVNMSFGYQSFLDTDVFSSSVFGEGGYPNTEASYQFGKSNLKT